MAGLVAIEGTGARSLAMVLLAGVSVAGGWCGVVGVSSIGAPAAQELGVRLERLGVVPDPGTAWADVVGAFVSGLDAVLVASPAPVSGALARRLVAKARQHRCTLFTLGAVWEGCDVRLTGVSQEWGGLGVGHGRLRSRRLTVIASDRRGAELVLWLPGWDGRVHATASGTAVVGAPMVAPHGRAS